MIDAMTEENMRLRQAVNELTSKIELLQGTVSGLMAIKVKLTQQPATPSLVRMPPPGSLVRTYLEGTPGARPVGFILQEANARVNLLLSKSNELLTKAKLIHTDATDFPAETDDDSEEQATMREKLAEALVHSSIYTYTTHGRAELPSHHRPSSTNKIV